MNPEQEISGLFERHGMQTAPEELHAGVLSRVRQRRFQRRIVFSVITAAAACLILTTAWMMPPHKTAAVNTAQTEQWVNDVFATFLPSDSVSVSPLSLIASEDADEADAFNFESDDVLLSEL